MRTSREWVEEAVADLDVPAVAQPDLRVEGAKPAAPGANTYELTLSREEAEALEAICGEDELSPRHALEHVVRARLLARPLWARGQDSSVTGARTQELLDLGAYLRRVGRAIGEAMSGNLDHWRADAAPSASDDDAPAPKPARRAKS